MILDASGLAASPLNTTVLGVEPFVERGVTGMGLTVGVVVHDDVVVVDGVVVLDIGPQGSVKT
jgi:hypothetical protein